ncbi:sodium:calcium antiporter [Patescibacteria group bacterium]|nr:sodium:calcium antiporter [Patescibacteria group bacterium]MBU4023453.1 sodium:calcium antiporter [Patescibacteria group bacterium]MBU4078049.1 sodium:calcium antiporter [Patescibacteria group bacterium]
MNPFIYILIFILSASVLAKAGLLAVNGLLAISKFLKWKKFVVGSLVMGLLSSMPELFVGISAALSGKPALAFGNVLGANIILFTLIAGVAVLFGGTIELKSKSIQRSLIFSGFYALMPLLLLVDGQFSRGDGILLMIALGFYLRELFFYQKKFSEVLIKKGSKETGQKKVDKDYQLFFKDLARFMTGFLLLIASAQGIVFSAGRLALALDLPLVFVGAIAVALGTSLPELSFGLRSIAMKQKQMLLGVIFGSVAINSSLILGLVCLISPFRVYNIGLFVNGFVFTCLAVLFFLIFFKTGNKLTKKEAKFLLFIYVLFFIIQILIK